MEYTVFIYSDVTTAVTAISSIGILPWMWNWMKSALWIKEVAVQVHFLLREYLERNKHGKTKHLGQIEETNSGLLAVDDFSSEMGQFLRILEYSFKSEKFSWTIFLSFLDSKICRRETVIYILAYKPWYLNFFWVSLLWINEILILELSTGGYFFDHLGEYLQ